MRVLLASSPWGGGYSSSATGEPWPEGEVREVEPEVGEYLLSTFPAHFVEHHDPAPDVVKATASAPIPAAPTRRRIREG